METESAYTNVRKSLVLHCIGRKCLTVDYCIEHVGVGKEEEVGEQLTRYALV